MSGLAVAATGVAVASGVVHAPHPSVDLADSVAPIAPAAEAVGHYGSGSAAGPLSKAQLKLRTQTVSRSADRRLSRDPAKQAALGLSKGPAVTGHETLAAQSPQTIAAALLPSFGFSSDQMSCLVPLWMGESGWRIDAENSSSGAYGIPQSLPGSKMASVAADWQTNAATQIKWGLGYIQERYGSPCGAWGFKQGHGWY